MKQKNYTEDQSYWIVHAMETRGGSFIQALCCAYERADRTNAAKIENAFPEYFETYLRQGMQMKKKETEEKQVNNQ